MAKRWMTQKRLKQKTYRERARGVMKRFSGERMSGGSRPNPEIMQWYKNAAQSLKKGIAVLDDEVLRFNAPRAEAQWKRIQLQNTRPEWMYFRLVDDAWLRARMYFQLQPNERCCVVEFHPRTGLHRRSIVYRNRDRAYHRWTSKSIDWSDELFHPSIPETFSPS